MALFSQLNVEKKDLVNARHHRYVAAPSLHKKAIVEEIINQILQQDGRFLRRHETTPTEIDHSVGDVGVIPVWKVESKDRVLIKTAQALNYRHHQYLQQTQRISGRCGGGGSAVVPYHYNQPGTGTALLLPPRSWPADLLCNGPWMASTTRSAVMPNHDGEVAGAVCATQRSVQFLAAAVHGEYQYSSAAIASWDANAIRRENADTSSTSTECLFAGKKYHSVNVESWALWDSDSDSDNGDDDTIVEPLPLPTLPPALSKSPTNVADFFPQPVLATKSDGLRASEPANPIVPPSHQLVSLDCSNVGLDNDWIDMCRGRMTRPN